VLTCPFAHPLDLGLGERRLDVEMSPLVWVREVELPADAREPRHTSVLTDLQELGQLDDLPLQAVFHGHHHGVKLPISKLGEQLLVPLASPLASLGGLHVIVDVDILLCHGPALTGCDLPADVKLALDPLG
jgi:hypothetical protein